MGSIWKSTVLLYDNEKLCLGAGICEGECSAPRAGVAARAGARAGGDGGGAGGRGADRPGAADAAHAPRRAARPLHRRGGARAPRQPYVYRTQGMGSNNQYLYSHKKLYFFFLECLSNQ